MSTIGELSDIGVADLIELFARRKKNGSLTVKINGQEVQLSFESGRLIGVSSSDITLRLGRMLVRQGLVDTARLLEALHIQAEAGPNGRKRSLGAILIERGWVTEGDLARCLEEQFIEVLARVISDATGIFVYDAAHAARAATDAPPLDASYLLDAAKERIDALRLLREQLPPPGAGISLTAKALASDSQLDALAPPEAMVVSVLRPGPKTYAELGVSLALDELSLGVAVLSLAEQGLVSFGTMHLNQRNSPRRPAAAAG